MRSASAARPCARRSSSWPPTVTWRTCRASFYVKRVTEDSAREIVEIIGPLDGRAALLAVGDMTDDDIAQLQFLHGSMQLAIEKGSTRNTTTCSTTSTTAMCASAAIRAW